jgi:hypothetical protein
MTSDELIDYLTMLSWSALCGIVEAGGSLHKFRAQPHPSPIVPTWGALQAQTNGQVEPQVAVLHIDEAL